MPQRSPAWFVVLTTAALLAAPQARASEPAAGSKTPPKTAFKAEARNERRRPAGPTQAAPHKRIKPATENLDARSLQARAAAIKEFRKMVAAIHPDPNVVDPRAGAVRRDDPKNEFVSAWFRPGSDVDDALELLLQFPELQSVTLTGTEVTAAGLTRVSRLQNLTKLGLESTPTTDVGLSRLVGLSKLQTLELSKTKATSRGMPWLAELKNLENLALNDTPVGDEGLKSLAALVRLKSLELNNTRVTDAGLAFLADAAGSKRVWNLKHLGLAGDRITDAGLVHVGRLFELERLDLSDTQITDEGFRQLDPLRKLTALNLTNTQIGDVSAQVLGARTDLRELALGGTALTDAGLAALAGLADLQSLDLSHTCITDAGLEHLADFHLLNSLNLNHTAITNDGLERLTSLRSLTELSLSGTKVDDPQLEPLKALPRLKSVEVNDAPLTASDAFIVTASPRANPAVQKILDALDAEIELEFVDLPLTDVVERLSKRGKIEIQLDGRSFGAAGKDPAKILVSLSPRRISPHDALKRILEKYGLAMAIRHDALMIFARPLAKGAR